MFGEPRPWWFDPWDALSTKKNGGVRSWALFFASAAFIISLISSPLSAGLLSPVIVQVSTTSMDSIMFRTISGAVLRKPTSAWLSTDLATLPFWPLDYTDDPLALDINVDPRQWVVDSVAYKVELNCVPMTVTDTHNITMNGTLYGGTPYSYNGSFHQIESRDGCIVTIEEVSYTPAYQGLWSSLNSALWARASNLSSLLTQPAFSNSTNECGNRTLLLLRTQQKFRAQLCSAEYYWANISANMSISQSSSRAVVDLEKFNRDRQPLDHREYDIPTLEASFFDSNPPWSTKSINAVTDTPTTYICGPILAIAASSDYENDVHRLLEDSDLINKTSALYQQFLGEMLLLALEPSLKQSEVSQSSSGEVYLTERRIVANEGIGITLGAILMLSGCCIGVVAYKKMCGEQHEFHDDNSNTGSQACCASDVDGPTPGEYANTPTALISAKAVSNAHWLLALIGVGAFATEAFTVGMSALWDLSVEASHHSFNISRGLELRRVPRIFRVDSVTVTEPSNHDVTMDLILESIYYTSVQSWLYSAAIELSQSGDTPLWSKDTWSFAPVDLTEINRKAASFGIDIASIGGRSSNITFQTPAARARLECEEVDTWTNTSVWVAAVDFTDKASWYNTTIVPEPREPLTSMLAKWIVGKPLNATYESIKDTVDPGGSGHPLFIWSEQPKLAAINCTPIFEHATANITVDITTGAVQDYSILGTPQNATEAWSDPYLRRNVSVDYSDGYVELPRDDGNDTVYRNYTVNWGHVFFQALISSSTANGVDTMYDPSVEEDLDDRVFNFRYPGLNVDFMSYCMLQLVKGDKAALLDPKKLTSLAQQTFSVFFKHFASSNVSDALGGQVFQPIGEKLPWGLGPAVDNPGGQITLLPPGEQGAFATENQTAPLERQVTATLSVPIEQLIMSPIAVYLCISILVLLCVTTAIIYTTNRPQLKALPRDVDTLASTIAFVHGSEKLLRWVQDLPSLKPSSLRSKHAKQVMARLGPFEDSKGNERWGIELVDSTASLDEGEAGSVRERSQMPSQQSLEELSRDRPFERSNSVDWLPRDEQQDGDIELREMRRLLVADVDHGRGVSGSDVESVGRASHQSRETSLQVPNTVPSDIHL
ncbi:hypothetical protein KCU78_g4591, partial [Aureobasidium melanogenum]